METDTNFNENLTSHAKDVLQTPYKPKLEKLLQNPYKPKLADGFYMDSSLLIELNQKFPYGDEFTIQGCSLNPLSGVPNHLFKDTNYDPYQSSSNSTYLLKDFILNAREGDENRFNYGSESRGDLNFPPKSSVGGMNQYETDKRLGFPEFGILKINLPGEDSCSMVTGGSTRKKAQSTKKRLMVTKKNEDNKRSILIKGQWTSEEDRLLMKMVKHHGARKWSQIAQRIPGRLGKQCRERWNNHLRPDIKKDIWSEEEDKILIEAHKEMGTKWSEIAKRIPGRSENTIKNHWNATKRKLLSSRRSPKFKYNSPLQCYIQSTINSSPRTTTFKETNNNNPLSNSSGSTEADQPEFIKAEEIQFVDLVPRNEHCERNTIVLTNYDNNVAADEDYHHNHVVHEGNVGFELPILGQLHTNQLQFEVKREMDFLEMLYQDIM